ncbi:MAG: LysM peptidoglycan-binding domain-containing protein, partial [Bacteroidota bacterium]
MIKTQIQKTGFFIFLVLSVIFNVSAQDEDSAGRRIVIDGKEYFLHVVEKGQGFYSIARQYNVSQQEILDANPDIDGELQKDQVIQIPVIKG